MLLANIIEDLVAWHLYECCYFNLNRRDRLSKNYVRKLKHSDRIALLKQVYGSKSGAWIMEALGLLSRIRNELAHAMVNNVLTDFRSRKASRKYSPC